ncbi:hypothetical protein BDV29DRAFT_65081 [Aspergillus leporis]|uniref:Uncharacterized protein n=1 Tax=Aspergillus leporis TaxID=41062 RepID=A0A5N5WJK7_9EURO|nr:hypothetical protein BDV29DRAFT_65081 [Aspergillus leporis]
MEAYWNVYITSGQGGEIRFFFPTLTLMINWFDSVADPAIHHTYSTDLARGPDSLPQPYALEIPFSCHQCRRGAGTPYGW